MSLGDKSKCRILFVSDTTAILHNYRSSLVMKASAFWVVDTRGVFESLSSLILLPFGLIRCSIFCSSNLRSNLFCSLFFWKRGVVILNGLGRYERSSFLRFLLVFLFKISGSNRIVLAQSYRDFRYLRLARVRVLWVPGSGGSCYQKGESDEVLVVTRDSKFNCIRDSLASFYKEFNLPLIVAGCKDAETLSDVGFDCHNIGFITSKNLLYSNARSFVQPDGYGEGIAHSLVDAICSHYRVFINRKVYLKSGFYMLFRNEGIAPVRRGDWYEITPEQSRSISSRVSLKAVDNIYFSALSEMTKSN